ncbi:hypothetical protein IG631_16711 [Alternaria alternata]|nr:hypothetical protein IG631_16711 [Alternaria alternata]
MYLGKSLHIRIIISARCHPHTSHAIRTFPAPRTDNRVNIYYADVRRHHSADVLPKVGAGQVLDELDPSFRKHPRRRS